MALFLILALSPLAGTWGQPRGLPRSEQRDHRSRATARSTTLTRDANTGKLLRSPAARRAFTRQHPCPATGELAGPCPGYVVDHVKPLACGGADAPSNMQWQTIAEGKAKDRCERVGCN